MTISGETNGVNAGTYSAKFVLNYGYVFPGGQNEATVSWVIDRAVIASLPKQSNVLAANGKPQSPTWDNYDTSKLTIGGERFGTEAKDYTATFPHAQLQVVGRLHRGQGGHLDHHQRHRTHPGAEGLSRLYGRAADAGVGQL